MKLTTTMTLASALAASAFGANAPAQPADELEAVWCTNRTDLEGSASPISKKVEELVFGCFGKGSGA